MSVAGRLKWKPHRLQWIGRISCCVIVQAARDFWMKPELSCRLHKRTWTRRVSARKCSISCRWIPSLQQLTWFGEPVDAARLHALGLVGWVCDSGGAFDAALRVAEQLAGLDPDRLAAAKERVQAASRTGHAGQANAERASLLQMLAPATAVQAS